MPPARAATLAVVAYALWGVMPLYWRALAAIPSSELLAWRVLSAAGTLALLLAATGRVREAIAALSGGGAARFALAGALIGGNWGLYIWAIHHGHTLEASLGYFINPLVTVALGRLLFGERLTPRRRAAVLLAGGGVAVALLGFGRPPWIALALAASFATYGVLRKRNPADALLALQWETALLAPIALAWLLLHRDGLAAPQAPPAAWAGLALAGTATFLPLLAFGRAAPHLPLSTLGVLQYLSPIGQFLIAVLAFGEPLTTGRAATFACIWAALALFSYDAFSPSGTPAAAPAPPRPR